MIATFLAHHAYAGACATPLAPGASFRRYLRLTAGPRPAVLMDAPPPEDVPPVPPHRHPSGRPAGP